MSAESKEQLRKEMREKRDSMSESERMQKNGEIMKQLFGLEELKRAKCVAFYLSKGSEVGTFEMIKKAMTLGKEILVPHTNDEIEFVKFSSFEELVPAKFGILEPRSLTAEARNPDIIILPGLAFDSDMHRLGYGKGYYDKLLKKLKSLRIGICFDSQLVERIPRHEHDERMDLIISEKRILRE